jgi:hypothetical protein
MYAVGFSGAFMALAADAQSAETSSATTIRQPSSRYDRIEPFLADILTLLVCLRNMPADKPLRLGTIPS